MSSSPLIMREGSVNLPGGVFISQFLFRLKKGDESTTSYTVPTIAEP